MMSHEGCREKSYVTNCALVSKLSQPLRCRKRGDYAPGIVANLLPASRQKSWNFPYCVDGMVALLGATVTP